MARQFATTHTHNQESPSALWVIQHGLNAKPSVSVTISYEGTQQAILPHSITYPDLNTVEVRFTQPYSGVARLF